MSRRFLFLTTLLLPVLLTAQNDFFSTDSITSTGVDIKDQGDLLNALSIKVKKGRQFLELSPYEAIEYGFRDKRYFRSFDVGEERYFLEQLARGEWNLYYLRTKTGGRQFFISADDTTLVQIPSGKAEMLEFLEPYSTDCPDMAPYAKWARFQGNSLGAYFQNVNDCRVRYFPKIRFGLVAGLRNTGLNPLTGDPVYSPLEDTRKWDFTVGLFADIPIYFSNLSFHPELSLRQIGRSALFGKDGTDYNLVINYLALDLPLLFRYTFRAPSASPFFELGPVFPIPLSVESTLYAYKIRQEAIYVSVSDSPALRKPQAGLVLGAGSTFPLWKQVHLMAEARYQIRSEVLEKDRIFYQNDWVLLLGLLF